MRLFINTPITDFSFGWDAVYQDALSNYPNGKHVCYDWDASRFGLGMQHIEYDTDPVSFRKVLVRYYEKTQEEARTHFLAFQKNGDPALVSELIRKDMILYALAWTWIEEYRDTDEINHHFNPVIYFRDATFFDPSRAYFYIGHPDPYAQLSEYRLIDWYLPPVILR